MRRRSIITLSLCAVTAMTLSSIACTFGTDCDFGLCPGVPIIDNTPDGSSTDGGADVDAAPIPEGCKPDMDPKDSPECLTDDFAVFVSPTGAPGAAGSRTAPVGTVTEALTKLIGPKGARQRIYVCAGTYDDAPSLTASNAVPIVGGFDCKQDWKYTGAKATLAPKQAGKQALTLDGVSGVRLVDLALNAPAGDAQNVNSIAVRALKSAASFLRVSITSADGAPGAPADAAGPAGTHTDLADVAISPNGNAATGNTNPGGSKTCKCTSGGTTTGGPGGPVAGNGFAGSANPAVTPVAPADGSGGTGGMDCTVGGGGGRPGTKPPRNTDGATPTKLGDLANDTWSPGEGTQGVAGNPGQGGGGGGGFNGASAGGGGACGGCGGGAGKPGKGGGASIAVLSIDSTLAFLAGSELTSAKGGVGGTGGEGGGGGGGGGGANGGPTGCSGGAGGAGGDGGHGSGGPGGLSVLILHKGKAPTVDPATKQTVGTEGGEGPGAVGGGNPGPKGQKGAVVDVASLPQ